MKHNYANIKKLRELTGAPLVSCQKVLSESGGDVERAIVLLRKMGETIANKKGARQTKAGRVEAYIHANGRVGSIVVVTCETDFVARNELFRTLAHDVAMQVTALNPTYCSPDDIPASVLRQEEKIVQEQLADDKKPEAIQKKIIEGKLQKWFAEVCLLSQPFIKDDSVTIDALIKRTIAKLGENIQIKKFIRFSLEE